MEYGPNFTQQLLGEAFEATHQASLDVILIAEAAILDFEKLGYVEYTCFEMHYWTVYLSCHEFDGG